MSSALHLLASAGTWALSAVWLPVLVWSVAALSAEIALRLWPRAHALLCLGVRRALLLALPVGIVAAALVPEALPIAAAEQVVALRPQAIALAPIFVGSPVPEAATSPLPLAPVASGLGLMLLVGLSLWRTGGVVLGLVRLHRLTIGGPASPEIQAETDHLARLASVRRPVRAVASDVPTVPFTYGWSRPVVVVPTSLTDEALRLALSHELTHIARGDFASGVAERLVGAAFGWHPLVALFASRIDLDRERAVDATVLAQRPRARRDYATLLLSFSRLPSPALALGAASGQDALTHRITTMQTPPLSPTRLHRLSMASRALGILLFAVAVAAASFVAVDPPEALAAGPASGDSAAETAAVPFLSPSRLPEASGEAAPHPQGLAIEGVIFDAQTGLPLVGASVQVAGTRLGAATDRDGRFTLSGADAGTTQLRISRAGYVPLTVVPQPGELLRVGLVPEAEIERMVPMRDGALVDSARVLEVPIGTAPAPDVFVVVEEPPTLVGGIPALQAAVVYPQEAKDAGIQGRVFVQFIVDEQGRVQDATCSRSPDERLCQAGIEAVRSMTFTPGRQRGKAVKVQFVLPILFALPGE